MTDRTKIVLRSTQPSKIQRFFKEYLRIDALDLEDKRPFVFVECLDTLNNLVNTECKKTFGMQDVEVYIDENTISIFSETTQVPVEKFLELRRIFITTVVKKLFKLLSEKEFSEYFDLKKLSKIKFMLTSEDVLEFWVIVLDTGVMTEMELTTTYDKD